MNGFSPEIIDWCSGLAGGTAQVLVGHPFDTIKVWVNSDCDDSSIYVGKVADDK